jgi:hypothetical protein
LIHPFGTRNVQTTHSHIFRQDQLNF